MLKAAKSGSSKDSYTTPPPSKPAPSPVSKPDPKPKVKPTKLVIPPMDGPPPDTEGARLARLRRLCELKPSGRCNVPDAIHQRWKTGGKAEREALLEELERAGWSKDWYFVTFHVSTWSLIVGSFPLKFF